MKVLHVCETVKGGIATYLYELVPEQVKLYGESNVKLVVSKCQRDQLELPDSMLLFFENTKRKSFKSQINMALRYKKAVDFFEPNIVHCHSTFAGFWFRLCVAPFYKNRFRLIYCSHGWAFDMNRSVLVKKVISLIERLLTLTTDAIVCISEYDKKSAIKVGLNKSKLVVVRNTIVPVSSDVTTIELNHSFKNFLFVGRFDEQKGFDLIIAALNLTTKQDFRLYCIGNSVVSKNNEVPQFKDSRLIHLGWLEKKNVLSYMKSCDAILIPSRWEGFGLVALEALAAGCPVYHSGVGGLPEIYPNSEFSCELEKPVINSIKRLIENSTKEFLTDQKKRLSNEFILGYTSKDLSMQLDLIYRQ